MTTTDTIADLTTTTEPIRQAMTARDARTIHAALADKIAALSTATLLDALPVLYLDKRDEAAIVFDFTLAELERRLPEGEFVAICDSF
jgi:hypothetical protein